jgi:Phage portal protein, SPP1 Gp6-like.
VVNNYTINSAIGIPFWYNAKDVLAAIDCAYDSLDCEVRTSRRKTFVSENLLNRYVDKDGRQVEPFDPNDTDFYIIPTEDDGKQLLQDSAPALRVEQITSALNMHLNAYSSKLGFGENFYVYNVQKNIQTATQVISENAQLFRTLKKHEILLEESMLSFFKALVYIVNNFTQEKFSDKAIESLSIHFDDSIIEDKGTEKSKR